MGSPCASVWLFHQRDNTKKSSLPTSYRKPIEAFITILLEMMCVV